MTPTSYTAIRHRLDHPQVVVWDGCGETLAGDDDEWPAPTEFREIRDRLAALPRRAAVICAFAAARDHLARYELEYEEELRPRQSLRVLARWLKGDAESRAELEAAERTARRAGVLAVPPQQRIPRRRPRLADALPHAVGAALKAARLARYAEHAAYAPHYLESSQPARRQQEGILRHFQMFLRKWWARCRALLPIADVTTAEIEWGDIELPPKPLNGDLPGDGSPGCVMWE